MTTLQNILNEAPLWGAGKVKSAVPLSGGLTNINYLIHTANDRFVLRINNPNAARLGINRQQELTILNTIKQHSFAPAIAYCCPQFNYLVSHYISGTSFAEKPATPAENEQLRAIISSYQQLSVSCNTLQYGEHLYGYYQTLQAENKLNAKLESDWQHFQPQLEKFEQSPWQAVLCHHDLIPANIIRCDSGLKIIDWEYATNGHPCFDLLNSSVNNSKQERLDNTALQAIIYWTERLWQAVQR